MGTPHLKVMHNYGSSDWAAGDARTETQLGMVPGRQRGWRDGTFAARIPPPVPVGLVDDFDEDLPWPFPEPARLSIDGVDSRCYTNLGLAFVDPEILCALTSCCVQLVYARLLELTHAEDIDTLRAFFVEWLGPTVTVTMFAGEPQHPAMCIVTHLEFTMALLWGSSNNQQLATQGFQSLRGPQDFGAYGTLLLWNQHATLLFQRLIDLGANAAAPLVLTGHSYGAAAACVAAARVRLADADRDVCLMTFGGPKPGDQRLIDLLDDVNQIHLQGPDDFVTVVPPDAAELLPFLGLIGVLVFRHWTRWRRIRRRLQLNPDGSTEMIAAPFLDAGVLRPIVARAIAGQPMAFIPSHQIAEYIRRLKLRCDEVCWPLTVPAWEVLFGAQIGNKGVLLGGSNAMPAYGLQKGGIVIGGGLSAGPPIGEGILLELTGTGYVLKEDSAFILLE